MDKPFVHTKKIKISSMAIRPPFERLYEHQGGAENSRDDTILM